MCQSKNGVLLVNLGTPAAATRSAIKRYLAQFLRDPRVIDLSRWLWFPLLYGVILPWRSAKLVKRYQSIWHPKGSPLLVYSRAQQQALAALLGDSTPVALAMTYGQPVLQEAVAQLLSQRVTRLVVLPLFPHYASATTAAVWDALAAALRPQRCLPEIHFIRDYATHPAFIIALQQQIEAAFHLHGRPDLLLFSYHGIPVRLVEQGDDYPQRCQATTRALVKALGLESTQYALSYQSRFGYAAWLKPCTDQQLQKFAKQGIRHLQVICPGFAADCLETLEEIAEQGRALFIKAGGKQFHYIPALNDTPAHIELLRQLVSTYLSVE